MSTSYDELCASASSAAELRLLDHFKQFGGEVWEIGSGCEGCRVKSDALSALKKCSSCNVALFCGRDCQKKAWKSHKRECLVISTLQRSAEQQTKRDAVARSSRLQELLQVLSWSDAGVKASSEPTVVGVTKSLAMDASMLPGWFFTEDFDQLSSERQKEMFGAALELYGLLRDDESWNRDKESFPRSSYTYVDSIAHSLPGSDSLRAEFVGLSGHLVLFSAWLQHPEPPATQSLPIESREFFGIVDSLLQIKELHDGVDRFMASRFD